MSPLRLDDLKQHSDVLRARDGEKVTARFIEPRDAECAGTTIQPSVRVGREGASLSISGCAGLIGATARDGKAWNYGRACPFLSVT